MNLMRGLTCKSLNQADVVTALARAGLGIACVPDDVDVPDNPVAFVPEQVKKLFEAGRKFGLLDDKL